MQALLDATWPSKKTQLEALLICMLKNLQGNTQVETPEHFMGRPSHYAMMGISKTIQHCYQVDLLAQCPVNSLSLKT